MKSLRIAVLAKQVPDTRNVGKDAMNEDGTINRAALPAIFNPEDMNALEQALRLKEMRPGSTVTVFTMGPERAKEIVLEGLFRGADGGAQQVLHDDGQGQLHDLTVVALFCFGVHRIMGLCGFRSRFLTAAR